MKVSRTYEELRSIRLDWRVFGGPARHDVLQENLNMLINCNQYLTFKFVRSIPVDPQIERWKSADVIVWDTSILVTSIGEANSR